MAVLPYLSPYYPDFPDLQETGAYAPVGFPY
jgi:hypothetical protein